MSLSPLPLPPRPEMSPSRRESLHGALNEARDLGFLGPGPIEQHIDHALEHCAVALEFSRDGAICDLGSGGGIPGLVLASLAAEHVCLIDAMRKRTDFLERAVTALGLQNVDVHNVRGEDFARTHAKRYALVVARSFGAPAVTAEIAARLLDDRGVLCVSSGPSVVGDWFHPRLGELGLGQTRLHAGESTFVVVERVGATPDRYPRRVGMPAKRPLW